MLPWLLTPWPGPSPALLARLFGNGKNSGLHMASLEGACRVECLRRGDPSPEGATGWLMAASGDQAELPGPRGGLGAVSGAELAQDVGHVRFDRVERHDQVVGDALV